MAKSTVLLFGDQTADQWLVLLGVGRYKDNAVLTSFLEQAALALRKETHRLPRARRELIPAFLRIPELIEAYHQQWEQGVRIPELESALVTVAQLAHYIGFFGGRTQQLPDPSSTRAVGLCTGLLAAAAVTSARSLSELVVLSVEAVKLAFRVGVCVGTAKDAFESAPTSNESWSTIFPNLQEPTAQFILDDFARQVPKSHQPYVSANSATAVTISGAPNITSILYSHYDSLKSIHRIPIPIYAPYHAPHLYHQADISRILDGDSQELLQQFTPQSRVHSASSGKCFDSSSTLDLVRSALTDILCQPVRWSQVLDQVTAEVKESGSPECAIHSFGITNTTNSLTAALKSAGVEQISVVDQSAWQPTPEYAGRTQNDKIAIVGMAGRFPNAPDHEALWNLLMKGLDVHREVPKDRFDAQAHTDPSGKGKNKSHTPYGCFIDEPGLFDPRFFNMSPREAAQTDPMGRLALVTAYEALEMSGYVPNRTPSTKQHRIGTFYGQTSDDWREINAAENIDTYFITGGVRAFAPGRINYYFKFSGPSFSIDTACSSSLAAIQLACTSLWAGDCDTACAGGLNVLTNPDIFAGLSKGQFLSKSGSCKTYDDGADGYCRGDGCASVVLKRYEDAVADKDFILGSILATGTNHSAEAVSITHPHAGAQEFLYKKILADAGVDAHDVSYVEMHGTGTQAGDGIEMTSVTNAFAPPHRRRRPDQPLHLGAIKANIGHGEAASGISALVKVLMMMRENYIPPNVGVKESLNSGFPKDLLQRNVHIPFKATPFPRNGAEKRLIFLNNFSAAGGNSAALLEDAPAYTPPSMQDPRSQQLIVVTARAISSLKRNIENLAAHLEKTPMTDISSLSYTLTARRIQHNYRVAFSVSETSDIAAELRAQIRDSYSPVPLAATPIAFAFTGQGSQYAGLGKVLYDELQSFRNDINWLDGLARAQDLPSFLPLLTGADVESLSPVVVQLGLSCIQVALARMWGSWGIQPQTVIGHSLGEYAALHVAGVLSASDMIYLVGQRAELLVSRCSEYTHGMLAVKGSEENIAAVLGMNSTEIACKNGPDDVVLCGSGDSIAAASETLHANGFKKTALRVPFAFHSAQVEPIMSPLERAAHLVTFRKPKIPILSPLTGKVITDVGTIDGEYLTRHARETVDFRQALEVGEMQGIISEKTVWLEIGAHPVCSGMIKKCLDSTPLTLPSLRRGEDPWKTITNTLGSFFLAGVHVNFDEFHREFNNAQELLLLPTYSFDNKKYWLDYHNNWCLTKGEDLNASRPEEEPPKKEPEYFTTSCQRLISEDLQANTGVVVFQSDLTDPLLSVAVTGHLVNNNPLYPSSLYADQALTAADYLYKKLRPKAPKIGLNVNKMEVPKSLIATIPPPPEGQHLQIEASADIEAGHTVVKFRSVTPDGKPLVEHAHCFVTYEDIATWQESWNMCSFMVKTQLDILRQKLDSGSAHKILRGMAYKLFKNFVDYSPPFRGMDEVIVNGTDTEASATVKFQADEKDGNFVCSPYWIDSLCHLSGFVCNGTDLIDSDKSVYISHGWGSLRFARPFSPDRKYTTYVRMVPQANKIRAGDVYILDGDEIVGVVGALKFQEIPRRLMNTMLPPPKNTTAQGGPQAAPAHASVSAKKLAPAQNHKTPVTKSSTSLAKTPAKSIFKSESGMIVSKVMKIVAEETDVSPAELVNEAAFENLGVDSLLSLSISARFREDLFLDVPSTLFTDHTTVGSLKNYFMQLEPSPAPLEASQKASSDTSSARDLDMLRSSEDDPLDPSTAPSSPPSLAGDEPDIKTTQPNDSTGPSVARLAVTQEMGVEPHEIHEKADLTEIGMDSLMSLTILSTLRERTGQDLPTTFLTTNTTIEDIEDVLGMRSKSQTPEPPKIAIYEPQPSPKSHPPNLGAVNEKLHEAKKIDVSKYPRATSLLLQGSTKTATKNLFLLPDGSGSATSYMNIPSIDPRVAVYGLNCPFMKTPRDFNIGVEGVVQIYIQEMKRRQPKGPYMIGGWSAGGVMAYEVASQMAVAGESVSNLVLIDSPSPAMVTERLPPGLPSFFDTIGLLGTGGTGSSPDWLLPHFESTICALEAYAPTPLPKQSSTEVYLIWAREGICGKPGDPQPERQPGQKDPWPMRFLLQNRTDFEDNGWRRLLDARHTHSLQMDGHHFSMFREPNVRVLADLIKQSIGM